MVKRKLRYITEQEIEDITTQIYNDCLVLEDEPEYEYKSKFDQGMAKKMLKEGEEYIQLEFPNEHYIVTSLGRLLNTNTVKQIKTTFSSTQNMWMTCGLSIKAKNIAEENGWDYDFMETLNRYKTNKWKHVVMKYAKKIHNLD